MLESNIHTEESFETFWAIYPRKIEKEMAYKQFASMLNMGYKTHEILSSAKLYKDYCHRRHLEESYIKTPVIFLKEILEDNGNSTSSLSKNESDKLSYAQMPSDASRRLRKLISEKKLLDENGNRITERTGFVEEFLSSGYWNSLPAFIQKAIVELEMS